MGAATGSPRLPRGTGCSHCGTTRRTSRGVISPESLKPVEFIDERTGRNTAQVDFDWQAGRPLPSQYKGEPRVEPLPPRAHDQARVRVPFRFRAAPARGPCSTCSTAGQSHHVYVSAGREQIKTPLANSMRCASCAATTGAHRDLARKQARLPPGAGPSGGEGRHPLRAGGDEDRAAEALARTLEHAAVVLARLLEFSAPADETLSRYFRGEPRLGRRSGFIAEAAFAVLRQRRSLEAAAGKPRPKRWSPPRRQSARPCRCARWRGWWSRGSPSAYAPRACPSCRRRCAPTFGLALGEARGRIRRSRGRAHRAGMLNPAPLDLRVNLARASRERCARASPGTASKASRRRSRPQDCGSREAAIPSPRPLPGWPGRSTGRGQPAPRLAARPAPRRDG